MTTIYVLAALGVLLLAYQLWLNHDPDELDGNGHPKRRRR